MADIIVVDLASDAGGAIVHARRDEGAWSYWREHSVAVADTEAEVQWQTSTTEPVRDLAGAVPEDWPTYTPMTIHPEFIGWFLANYESAVARLPSYERDMQARHTHSRWLAAFTTPPPTPAS